MEENLNNAEQPEVQTGRKNKIGVLRNIEEQYYPQIFKIINSKYLWKFLNCSKYAKKVVFEIHEQMYLSEVNVLI